jgi:hypothetical protein
VAAAERIFDGMKQQGVERNIFHYNAVGSASASELASSCTIIMLVVAIKEGLERNVLQCNAVTLILSCLTSLKPTSAKLVRETALTGSRTWNKLAPWGAPDSGHAGPTMHPPL